MRFSRCVINTGLHVLQSEWFQACACQDKQTPGKPGGGGTLRYIIVVCAFGGATAVICYCMSKRIEHVDILFDGELSDSDDWCIAFPFP